MLEKLGWERRSGEVVDAHELRERLNVNSEHSRLFLRMLEMLGSVDICVIPVKMGMQSRKM